MNPTDPRHPWSRLTAAARTLPDERDPKAPYGFATRVAALAMAPERVSGSLLERFSLRALGLAGLLALVCVAANFSTVTSLFRDEAASPDDPVAEIVDREPVRRRQSVRTRRSPPGRTR